MVIRNFVTCMYIVLRMIVNSMLISFSSKDYLYHNSKYVIVPVNIPINLHTPKGGENVTVIPNIPATVL